MRYFDHDTTASKDDEIMSLRMEHGSTAVDAYWMIIERIYLDEEPVNLSALRPLSVWLAVGFDEVKTYVNTMISLGLLVVQNGGKNGEELLTSARAEANIAAYQEKCKTARQNGRKGGRKPKRKADRNQEKTQSVPIGLADAKLRKEKKGIGYLYGNQIPSDSVAAADKTAPLSKAERDRAEQHAHIDALEAAAVPCPEHIAAKVVG